MKISPWGFSLFFHLVYVDVITRIFSFSRVSSFAFSIFFFLSLLLRVLVPFFSLSFLLFLSAGCCLKFRSIFHHPFLEFRPFYCERKRHATFLIFCVSVPQRCFNFSSFPLAVFHPDNATPFLTCTPRNTL